MNVIYDCGSATDAQLVEQQIRNTFERGEMIHAVFISHLDVDHSSDHKSRCKVYDAA